MPEIENVTFTHKEIAEMLVRKQNLHEGLWGIFIEFGLSGANIGESPESDLILPAAVIPVLKIGIQRFKTPNNLTVDAAVINPE
jgi:hypothetical protein